MLINKDDYFSKIPNKLFYCITDEDSIFKLAKDIKVLLVLDYLYTSNNRKNNIKFTLEDMIIDCGYTPNSSKNRINDQFKTILSILSSHNLVKYDNDFKKIKPTELLLCTLDINLNSNFFQLFEKEKNLIMGFKDDEMKIDNAKLLFYYCYIKSRMYNRPKGEDLSVFGGRAEITYPSFKMIKHDLGFTDETIKKYNDLLIQLNLIRIGNAGLWYFKDDKNKIVKESPNFYTLFKENEEEASHNINEGIKYYRLLDCNSNKIFINSRKYQNNNRSVNGEYGSIIKKEINGTATTEDIKRKNEIIESKNADEELYRFKALLDKNPNDLLYLIYDGLGNSKLADQYYDLEVTLGLIDEESNMLVDRDYYVWALSNYHNFGMDYMKNCIAKHKEEKDKTSSDDIPVSVRLTKEIIKSKNNEEHDDIAS